MKRDDTIYIDHILGCIQNIEAFILDRDVRDFTEDVLLQSALIRQFEVIREATKRVSEEFRIKNPAVPWKDMAGMRDKLIHDYFDVDLNIVWETATKSVPELKVLFENLNY